MRKRFFIALTWTACLALVGCNMPAAAGSDPAALGTSAAQTVQVALSAAAPTGTPPIAAVPLATATATAACEERTEIVSWTRDGETYDAKEADKNLAPDSAFTMSWQIKNDGTC